MKRGAANWTMPLTIVVTQDKDYRMCAGPSATPPDYFKLLTAGMTLGETAVLVAKDQMLSRLGPTASTGTYGGKNGEDWCGIFGSWCYAVASRVIKSVPNPFTDSDDARGRPTRPSRSPWRIRRG